MTRPLEHCSRPSTQPSNCWRQARDAFVPRLVAREVGTVNSVDTGVARVSGLPGVGYAEVIRFPGDVSGIAFNVDDNEIGVVLLGDHAHLHAGDEVERKGRVMDVAVGECLLGRVIDPLGRPLDGQEAPTGTPACRSSAPHRRSWTARASTCRCRLD